MFVRVCGFSVCVPVICLCVRANLHRRYGKGMGDIVVCEEQCVIRLSCSSNEINHSRVGEKTPKVTK